MVIGTGLAKPCNKQINNFRRKLEFEVLEPLLQPVQRMQLHPTILLPYTIFRFYVIFPINGQMLHLSNEIFNKGTEFNLVLFWYNFLYNATFICPKIRNM